jgi:hypothetical protein
LLGKVKVRKSPFLRFSFTLKKKVINDSKQEDMDEELKLSDDCRRLFQ